MLYTKNRACWGRQSLLFILKCQSKILNIKINDQQINANRYNSFQILTFSNNTCLDLKCCLTVSFTFGHFICSPTISTILQYFSESATILLPQTMKQPEQRSAIFCFFTTIKIIIRKKTLKLYINSIQYRNLSSDLPDFLSQLKSQIHYLIFRKKTAWFVHYINSMLCWTIFEDRKWKENLDQYKQCERQTEKKWNELADTIERLKL